MKLLKLSLVLIFLGFFIYSTALIYDFIIKLYHNAGDSHPKRTATAFKLWENNRHIVHISLSVQMILSFFAIVPVKNTKLLYPVVLFSLLQIISLIVYYIHFIKVNISDYSTESKILAAVIGLQIGLLVIFGVPYLKCLQLL